MLRDSRSHAFAFLRTFLARISTALAMLDLMLSAFFATRPADIGADLTDFSSEVGTTRHECRSSEADLRAISVQLDTAGHHLHVFFLQACGRAMLAFHSAVVAGLDTALIFLVCHNVFSFGFP
jgi:hypothetical protein